MLSDSPPERDLEWSEAGIEGAARFVQRVWRLATDRRSRRRRGRGARAQASPHHRRGRRGDRRAAVQQGGRPALRAGQRDREGAAVGRRGPTRSETLVKLIAPMAPHLAEEAGRALGEPGHGRRRRLAGLRPGAAGRRPGDARGPGQRQAARHADTRRAGSTGRRRRSSRWLRRRFSGSSPAPPRAR